MFINVGATLSAAALRSSLLEKLASCVKEQTIVRYVWWNNVSVPKTCFALYLLHDKEKLTVRAEGEKREIPLDRMSCLDTLALGEVLAKLTAIANMPH